MIKIVLVAGAFIASMLVGKFGAESHPSGTTIVVPQSEASEEMAVAQQQILDQLDLERRRSSQLHGEIAATQSMVGTLAITVVVLGAGLAIVLCVLIIRTRRRAAS